MQLMPLVSEDQKHFIMNATLYSNGIISAAKLLVLLWLFGWQMRDDPCAFSLRMSQALGIWVGSCFLPYGDFLMDCGYKKFQTEK